ncbi:MAG TPA: sugar phosphate nucleotidyltransferase [Steroidobacteraceae bacterium]|jgi:mannose-1-phosphate guanylyltransferase
MGLHILVLAGGSGTRLWPLSRRSTPKHLLPLAPGGETLLRATLERVIGLGESVRVVTAADQVDGCRSTLAEVGLSVDAVIAEPEPRGTGPALGLAVALIAREDPDALIASVHADHRVSDRDAYRAAVLASAGWAAGSDGLATVGLVPAAPVTGFGYIELGAPRDPGVWRPPSGSPSAAAEAARMLPAFEAKGFTEKPSAEVAQGYLDGGRHLWNLGLFAWTARRFLAELEAADPELGSALTSVVDAWLAGDRKTAARRYASLRVQAVEPLVLERTQRLTVVQASFGWSDLGSWTDVRDARLTDGEADADGNVVEGDVVITSSRDCTVVARSGRVVALVGGDGLVVVDTPDAVLVIPASCSQLVKQVVEHLDAEGRDELL